VPTDCAGILQLDLVIRPALDAGIAELRAQPDLLDYAFNGLRQDFLTSKQYGDQLLQQAKKWFLATDIPVVMARRLDQAKLPCVTVSLIASRESRNTLDDRSYKVREYLSDAPWQDLVPPFEAYYESATGIVKIPSPPELVVVPGMWLVDRSGQSTRIVEVLAADSFTVAANLQLDLATATIRGKYPKRAISIHSAVFDEQVLIGCHVIGDQSRLQWLHTIICFTLLRIRRRLLEGRELEVTSISSSDIREGDTGIETQPGYSRYVTVSGQATHEWVDSEADVVQGVRASVASVGQVGGTEVAYLDG